MILYFSLKSFEFGFVFSQSARIAGMSHHIIHLFEYY